MSGYEYGRDGYGGPPPYQGQYGGPPQYGYGGPPPPPGYPGGYPPPPPGHCPPPPGPWTPPNRGYGWYQWERPSHCRGEFHWIHCEAGQIPYNAVHAGRDKDGGPLYAGRAYYEGDLLPAKIAPSHHKAYVPWGGREHVVHQFEVLVSHHAAWEEDRDGRVPSEAIVVGQTADGENLYMGRTMHDGTLTPGKQYYKHKHTITYCYWGTNDPDQLEVELEAHTAVNMATKYCHGTDLVVNESITKQLVFERHKETTGRLPGIKEANFAKYLGVTITDDSLVWTTHIDILDSAKPWMPLHPIRRIRDQV